MPEARRSDIREILFHAYRIIYQVAERKRKVLVGHVRLRDAHTYSGMNKW